LLESWKGKATLAKVSNYLVHVWFAVGNVEMHVSLQIHQIKE